MSLMAVLLSVSPALRAQSEPPEKAPWQWTLEERIAARYNPERMRERVERGARQAAKQDYEVPPGQQTISGHEEPEQFLPTEVMSELLYTVFGSNREARQIWRRVFEERLAAAGVKLPADFYRDLSILANEHLGRLHRARQKAQELPNLKGNERAKALKEIQALQQGGCERTFELLTQARALFGQKTFDEILYVGIAVGKWQTFVYKPGDEARARHIEEGCK